MKVLVMTWLWCASQTNYSVINIYLKHLPGSLYLNLSMSGLSEIGAHIVVSLFFLKLTPRWTFFTGYAIATLGGLCLVWQNKFNDNTPLVAAFVLLAKFGISMAVCACYISTPFIFPLKLCGTAFGICNLFARFLSITAPYIVELEIPVPMSIFSILSLISLVVSLFVSRSDK